jgi:hypothetical protein
MSSNAKLAVKLQPKGLYCCDKCSKQVELFIRVAEVRCNQHGQMRKAGK